MKRLILILQFFTRIPLNFEVEVGDGDFEKGIVWFPVTGIIIGVFNALFYVIPFRLLGAPLHDMAAVFPAVMCVLGNCLITGAMQLDAFSDSCDGLLSVRDRERILEIMKDSRMGTFGTLGLFMNLAIRISLLVALGSVTSSPRLLMTVIIASPIVGKAVSGFLMRFSKDAREGKGMGSMFMGKIGTGRAVICLVSGFIAVVLLPVLSALTRISAAIFLFVAVLFGIAFIISLASGFIFKHYAYKKIAGMTGDTIGAASEIADLTFQLVILFIIGLLMGRLL